MMYSIDPNNNHKNLIKLYALMVIAFLVLVIFLASCKSRKMQKESEIHIDKSEQNSTIHEFITIKDSAQSSTQKDIKESAQSNEKFDVEETTKIYKDSVIIIKKTKSNKHSQSDKSDKSKIDWIENHSEIKEVDSTGTEKKDIEDIKSSKKLDAKDKSPISWALFGIILGIVGAIFIYIKLIKK